MVPHLPPSHVTDITNRLFSILTLFHIVIKFNVAKSLTIRNGIYFLFNIEIVDCEKMVAYLETLCLRSIIENLRLNNLIIRREKWIIPVDIANLIYLFYFENVYDINENDFEIFSSSFCSISKIIIDRKFYQSSRYFLNINTEKLKEIHCCLYLKESSLGQYELEKEKLKQIYLEKYWLTSLNNLLKRVNCVEILNVNFLDLDSYYYSRCNDDKFREVFNLFSQYLGKTLTELNIILSKKYQNCFFILKEFKNFLENCSNLINFKFQNELGIVQRRSFIEDLNLSKNLQQLYITIPSQTKKEKLFNFFNKLERLKIVSIDFENCGWQEKILSSLNGLLASKLCLEVLEILSANTYSLSECVIRDCREFKMCQCTKFLSYALVNFSYLKVFHYSSKLNTDRRFKSILPKEKNKFLNVHLSSSLLDSKELEDIISEMNKFKIYPDTMIIDQINFNNENSSQMLKKLSKVVKQSKIYINVLWRNVNDFKDFQHSFKKFRNINFFFKINVEKNFLYINLTEIVRKEYLSFIKELQLEREAVRIIENKNLEIVFKHFCYLEIIQIYGNTQENSYVNIFNGLSILAMNLREINLIDCNILEENRESFENLIQRCVQLKSLAITGVGVFLDEEFLDIIGNLKAPLSQISFSIFKGKLEELIKFLKKLKEIKRISILLLGEKTIYDIPLRLSDILLNFQYTNYDEIHQWKSLY